VLALALAGLAASWNPVAAPRGILVGAGAALLAARALRRAGERRRLAAAALAVAVLAVAASAIVLVLTAGTVGVELPGQPVVKGRTQVELDRTLDDAGGRTSAERQRAARELDRLVGSQIDGGARERQEGARPP